MSYVIYSIIALLIIGIIYGTWARKQIYRDVDRLGIRKVELMNRPVTEELSRMKSLKLSGETEERFEEWRTEWDQLVTVQLPDIEEKLFDIEELANRYRFPRAKQEITNAGQALDEIEAHIDHLIKEVHELVHSEEQNRHDIDRLQEFYEETKKKLWVQKGTLGTAAGEIDASLKETVKSFEDFHELTEEGNYFQAREALIQVRESLEKINHWIDEIPSKLLQVSRDLPAQVRELENGILEMKRTGFAMDLFNFEEVIQELRNELETALKDLRELRVEEAKEKTLKVEETLAAVYEELEQEALSKNEVEKALDVDGKRLHIIADRLQLLQEELDAVKASYRLSEENEKEVEAYLDHWKELSASFAVMETAAREGGQTYTITSVQLKEWEEQVEGLEQAMEETKGNFDHLRQDERSAADKVIERRRFLRNLKRKLKLSTLPKVPQLTKELIIEAEKKLSHAEKVLEEVPLVMEDVRSAVSEAEEEVDKAENAVEKILADGKLAEKVIQYGNRYRSRNDHVNILLLQAEDKFRQGYYEEALEQSVEAVEKVDKNVLERMQQEVDK
ncbi:septation ring formation regulator EzrA [Alkalicoccus daliensis]|uniref:Septation ring formation regulator n=1 Tax=Alkalicoccus daliensis TaxID=745820 RepID=A0A1H0CAB1_9BACI|nr:septation ring formation regulator EzrA [Alkalicoccus daliensis]SDN54809.1 septation ring formation regulator [Alkalicoccus daliensis]